MNGPRRFHSIEVSEPEFESAGLRMVTVKSPHLRGRGDLTLHVPKAARGCHDLPLVLLLHGIYGSHWGWSLRGGAHETNERLSRHGTTPPFVLAMPSDGLWGDGSLYTAHGGRDFARWIVEDVPAVAREIVPEVGAGSPVFIAGLSLGGFAALRLGALFPESFAGMSGLSSVTDLSQLIGRVEEDITSLGIPAADWALIRALRCAPRLPPFRFDCGHADPLIEPNRILHQELTVAGIAHRYEEFPGAHDWDYWRTRIEGTLRFFASLC
jgi:putative tributyrin esterase